MDHIRLIPKGKELNLICEHCKKGLPVELPICIADVNEMLRNFKKRHKRCRSDEEQMS